MTFKLLLCLVALAYAELPYNDLPNPCVANCFMKVNDRIMSKDNSTQFVIMPNGDAWLLYETQLLVSINVSRNKFESLVLQDE